MKTILLFSAAVAIVMLQAGCSTSASVGPDGHRHGVSTGVSTAGPGASVHARAY